MLQSLVRRAAQPAKPAFNAFVLNNPYRAKRLWPPDLTKLSPKHQFRLERKYRRRSKLKYQSPKWIQGVKLAQWGIIIFVLFYGVLYLDWEKEHNPFNKEQPFQGVRNWWHGMLGSIWTPRPRTPDRAQQQKTEEANQSPKVS